MLQRILMVTWPQGSSGQEFDVVPQLESPSQARICLSSCCRTWELFKKKGFWNIEIVHLRIFFLSKVSERLRLATWGQERVEKLHCSLQEAWRGYLGEKVKLTMSRSFLFLRSFGCNLHLCQQHWLKDPKNRGYAEKKDGKEGRTDHSEAAMSNWSTDLKLCNSIE